jgi:hypothetical protein
MLKRETLGGITAFLAVSSFQSSRQAQSMIKRLVTESSLKTYFSVRWHRLRPLSIA